jgi:hypothetical protein
LEVPQTGEVVRVIARDARGVLNGTDRCMGERIVNIQEVERKFNHRLCKPMVATASPAALDQDRSGGGVFSGGVFSGGELGTVSAPVFVSVHFQFTIFATFCA